MVNHDRYFKQLIGSLLPDFIRLFLPELAAMIDNHAEITQLDKEIFTDLTFGETHEADLVMKVRLKNAGSYFLVHIEAQAQHQPEFPRRMFTYFARLSEKFGMAVYPIVMFSFTNPKTPQPSSHKIQFADFEILTYQFKVIQLNQLDWRDYLESDNKVAAALMAKMRVARKERPIVKLKCMSLLSRLRANDAEIRLISEFIYTYLRLNAREMEVYKMEFAKLNPTEQENIMHIETSWERKGRMEGRVEGRVEGRAEVLLRQLHRRFGNLEAKLISQLNQLNMEQLDNLALELLDFSKLEDLTGWLSSYK